MAILQVIKTNAFYPT